MLGSRLIDDGHMIRQRRHQSMLLTDRAPVRFEAKTTVIMAESIEEMPALEVENAVIALLVMPCGCFEGLQCIEGRQFSHRHLTWKKNLHVE